MGQQNKSKGKILGSGQQFVISTNSLLFFNIIKQREKGKKSYYMFWPSPFSRQKRTLCENIHPLTSKTIDHDYGIKPWKDKTYIYT